MSRSLVNSALFSLSVHAILLLRLGFPGWFSTPVETDVRRGISSVELELNTSEDGEGKRARSPSMLPVQPMLDDGVQVRWKLGTLQNPPPRYPWVARIQGWEGTVLVRAMVTPTGEAASVQVRKSSGYTTLDQAASAAVSRWRFVPAQRKGRTVASSVEVPITFRLEQP